MAADGSDPINLTNHASGDVWRHGQRTVRGSHLRPIGPATARSTPWP